MFLSFLSLDLSNVALRNLPLIYFIDVILPVGISFYTFQSMSYTIDVYRGKIRAERSFLNFAVYVSFFPQLVAGPIVFARNFLFQLHSKPTFGSDSILRGGFFVIYGFFLKSVIADNLALSIDAFFANPSAYDIVSSWVYCYSYSIQIFCDFAGYSYIAIGLGKIIGFQLPPNFNYPYLATSLREFWRRWHISLSTWLKEYLYFSLGGSRISLARTCLNLMICMLLGGLWHGASMNFVFWGGIHGLGLLLERLVFFLCPGIERTRHPILIVGKWIVTYHVVAFAWIVFRTSTIGQAYDVIHSLFQETSLATLAVTDREFFFIGLFVAVHIVILLKNFVKDNFAIGYKILSRYNHYIYGVLAFVMFHMCINFAARSESFIYFQF